jgi:hypothetical protein
MIEVRPGIFVGWARSHINRCSCSSRFYRPHLFAVRKRRYKYEFLAVSGPVDFGVSGREFAGFEHPCVDRDEYINAVIPTAIDKWDSGTMTVVFYRQDRDRVLVDIYGLTDHIAEFVDGFRPGRSDGIMWCGVTDAVRECLRYPPPENLSHLEHWNKALDRW